MNDIDHPPDPGQHLEGPWVRQAEKHIVCTGCESEHPIEAGDTHLVIWRFDRYVTHCVAAGLTYLIRKRGRLRELENQLWAAKGTYRIGTKNEEKEGG